MTLAKFYVVTSVINVCFSLVPCKFIFDDLKRYHKKNEYFNTCWYSRILRCQKCDISLHTLISLVFEEQIEVCAFDYGMYLKCC